MNFELPPGVQPISDAESPAYSEIYGRVNQKFGNMKPELRDLIFCVAYTSYKRKKREYGAGLGDRTDKEKALMLTEMLANEVTYNDVITDAENRIIMLRESTSTEVLQRIGSKIIDGLDEKIHHRSASVPRRFWLFLYDSMIHGLHIVVAALLIYAAAQLVLFLGPTIGDFLDSIGFKYLGDLLQSIGNGED